MQVHPITQISYGKINLRKENKSKQVTKLGNNLSKNYSNVITVISFTGKEKNLNQILSIAPENNGLGLPEDAKGGLGVVTYEGPTSMITHEGKDVRHFGFFHEYNNEKGGFKFLVEFDDEDFSKGLPDKITANHFISVDYGKDLEAVARDLNKNPKKLHYVIQSKPDGTEANSLSKYCILEPTSVKGSVKRISSTDIGAMEDIAYQIFKISDKNPKYNKIKGTPNYFMYTRELAKTPEPYSYGRTGIGGMDAEIIASDMMRAILDALPKMNTEEFGYFNPASVWLHDRPTASFLNHIAKLSSSGNDYYNGIMIHYTYHNPGRNYQGFTSNPFLFLRLLAGDKDVEYIKKSPLYTPIQLYSEKDWNTLNPKEKEFIEGFFAPLMEKFKDFFNTYNISKIPIVAKLINSKNSSLGTVSPNFGKEMINPEMDVASGLRDDFKKVEMKNILNGSTPANLNLDNSEIEFGRGKNGLSINKKEFKTFKYNGNNIEEIIRKRQENGQWLTGLIEEASKSNEPNAVAKIFFNDLQIKEGRSVIGNLSKMKDDDILFMGWGRPDEQKGYPITLEGFLKFLKSKDVTPEIKQKVKFIVGAGDAPWDKNARDYKLIVKILKEIEELDGGIYKNNAIYVNGFFPNRLVGCATYGIFTSRREMCGITPLECKAAGVSYLVTKTGGPVDYTNKSNGYMTKNPVEMNPDFDGKSWNDSSEIIDDARIERSSNEIAEKIKEMVNDYNNDFNGYVAKCKKNIEEKIDWHENAEYNGGKTANESYLNDVFQTDKTWEERPKEKLNELTSINPAYKPTEIKENVPDIVTTPIKKNIKEFSKKKIFAGIAIAGSILGSGIYYLMNQNKKTNSSKESDKLKKETAPAKSVKLNPEIGKTETKTAA